MPNLINLIFNNISKKRTINFLDSIKDIVTEHNPSWLQTTNRAYRILTIGGSVSAKLIKLLKQPKSKKIC